MLPTVPWVSIDGPGAGEAGGEGFAGLQALRQAGAGGEGEQQQSGSADELHSTAGELI